MVFQVGVALILALLVDSIRVGAQVFRTLYFFPIVISATALGLMFNLIFLFSGGMLNQLLMNLGLISQNIDWKDADHFLPTMLAPVMWQYVGFYFVILVTGLNNISQDLYEAAALDGCVGLVKVRYITLPLLRSVLCTCLVLAITGALKVFDLPWVMFGPGMPQNQGWLTGTYMYHQTFNRGNVDYGSAIAMLIVVLGVWSLTTLYPFVWVILNSFREKGLIRKDSFSSPTPANGFTLDNYAKAMDRFDFGSAYLNSLIVSVSVTLVVVVLAGLAAYGLVRCRFACGACATASSWRG